MSQNFLTRIILSALFIGFLIVIYLTFFSGIAKPVCSSNQEYAIADLVNKAMSAYNPKFISVKYLKIFDCTKEIRLFSDRYEIEYKDNKRDAEPFKSKILSVNIDTAEILGMVEMCETADSNKLLQIKPCKKLPDSSGSDSYRVIVSPQNLKFFSSKSQ